MNYDYLIVGCGIFGTTFARLATDAGKKCLIIDKREHIGGSAYTENNNGIKNNAEKEDESHFIAPEINPS